MADEARIRTEIVAQLREAPPRAAADLRRSVTRRVGPVDAPAFAGLLRRMVNEGAIRAVREHKTSWKSGAVGGGRWITRYTFNAEEDR